MIFQKRMSIAHSVMLLITLLFVLTTRGVTLDLSNAVRGGLRGGLMTPTTTSPTGRRHHLRSQSEDGQMTGEYILTPNTALTKLARARKGWNFAQARSAPTSP